MGIYCLLVGINDYAGDVPNLGGCHNDVERLSNVLTTRFNIAADNIKVLLSETATKANIVAGFLTHLKQARANDTVVFYYSGHGSQERAPKEFWNIESDHQNETLVCHDSRVGGGDLADKELRFLISEVAKSGAEVVVLLDCCHSGNGTRATLDLDNSDALVSVRLAKKATYSRQIENYCFYEQAKQEGWLYEMQHMPEGKHLMMSGCEDSELSKELNIQGKRHGAFTHYLCETLENTQYSLSYQNLLGKIKLQVRNLVDKQNPSLMAIKNATIDKLFLGNEIQPLRLALFIKSKQWYLDAGAIHALHKGDEIAVYTDADLDTETQILLTTTLKEVQPEKSLLLLNREDAQKLQRNHNYYAEVIRQHIPKMSIAFTGDLAGTMHLFSAIETLDQDKNPSLYLQEVAPIDCEYRIVAEKNHYVIMSADEDHPLFKVVYTYSAASAKTVLQQAEHLARWKNKLALINTRSRIPTDIVQMLVTVDGEEESGDRIDLSYRQENGIWQAPEFTIALRYDTEAEYNKPLFCSVLIFNPFDASVDTAMDNGIWLRPTTVFENDAGSINKVHKVVDYALFDGESVEAIVEDERFERGITQTQDIFKLIVSETPFNADLLIQEGLDSYQAEDEYSGRGIDLDSMLDENFAETTRKIKRKSKKMADWNARSLTINTVRPMQATPLSSQRAISLGVGIEVAAHELDAVLALESSQQNSRAVSDDKHNIHPDCFNLGNNQSAFGFSTGRSVDAGLDTLVIQTQDIDALQNQLSSKTPLVLSIDKPLQENEQILPYVSDGEFFYPVGFSEKQSDQTQIFIQNLPTTPTDQNDRHADNVTQGKGLIKSFKVFFQKVAYDKLRLEFNAAACLSIAQLSDSGDFQSAVEVSTDHAAQIQNAQRIVLLIHGIAGETESMLDCLNVVDEYNDVPDHPLKDAYDLVLRFDYESLNTPIEETARILKQKLEDCGLGADHSTQLDIIAFDMGGLVTRWMIEKEQCDDGRINQLILLGVPNQGSPWASLQDKGHAMVQHWAYSSLTLILNNLTAIPIGGHIVAGLMKLIEAADNTLEQLHPESELITALAQTQNIHTTYTSIIGTTENLMIDMGASDKNQWAKMMFFVMHRSKLAAFDFLTEKLFQQSNDFAFSDESMRAFPESFIEKVRFAKVDCDHFSYCKSLQSVQQIKQALL